MLTDIYRSAITSAVSRSGALGQFALGCFLYCGDYTEREDFERRLTSSTQQAMADAYPVCQEAAQAENAEEVAEFALELLEIARNHGLLKNYREEGTQAQKRMEQKADAEEAADAADMVRLPSPAVRNTESHRDVQRATQARAGLSDRKGASELAGDASTDQLLRVSEAPTVYLPTGMGGKLIVTPAPTSFARFGPQGLEAVESRRPKVGGGSATDLR